jgi:pyruvate/2-oxoglutarate dehydrogenase complex dihydrolipoamide dehydrogenase (E3) component
MTEGRIKVMVRRGGRQVLGASILGAQAGELIWPFTQLIARGRPLGDLLAGMAPYPTLNEAAKRTAGAVYGPKLFNDKVRRLVAALAWFG